MRDLTKVAIHQREDGTTCPLTCSKCGAVIERGVGMSWTRGETPIREFWHTACESKRRPRLTGAARRIAAGRKLHRKCGWFLLCENPATTTRPHPILGEVVCCDGCKGRK